MWTEFFSEKLAVDVFAVPGAFTTKPVVPANLPGFVVHLCPERKRE